MSDVPNLRLSTISTQTAPSRFSFRAIKIKIREVKKHEKDPSHGWLGCNTALWELREDPLDWACDDRNNKTLDRLAGGADIWEIRHN
ncbi:MAG: hypothetical protein Q9161_002815 [Pseudevernia consocians]